jgi:vacuolar iron transporter family protein
MLEDLHVGSHLRRTIRSGFDGMTHVNETSASKALLKTGCLCFAARSIDVVLRSPLSHPVFLGKAMAAMAAISEDQMSRLHVHPETHLVDRIGWLRAAVLGANDGIVSTASLIVGVAAAAAKPADILIAGVAGLVAGAMSMAAGEYVSVSSQSDTERADISREQKELTENVGFEREELAQIYVTRGVDLELARRVADQLMSKDALGTHARDELGISEMTAAQPVQAALTSAMTFAIGAAMPLLMVLISPTRWLIPIVSVASLAFLALLGAVGAKAGGADVVKATARVTFWGAPAMALTAGIGKLFGTAV